MERRKLGNIHTRYDRIIPATNVITSTRKAEETKSDDTKKGGDKERLYEKYGKLEDTRTSKKQTRDDNKKP